LPILFCFLLSCCSWTLNLTNVISNIFHFITWVRHSRISLLFLYNH
jgi:hypothetical protein